MNTKISVVINTLNEEKNIERAIKSVAWADEILVCDMFSEDKTVALAKKLGARVIFHQKTGYVEPARNFAIKETKNPWVLILDADEEIPDTLAQKLQEVAKASEADYVEIPRVNIIFGKEMKASGWWPDYNIRFFKKGSVTWKNEIHSKPETSGIKFVLPEERNLAIIHYNYSTFSQFLERMERYSSIQAKELEGQGVEFSWRDLLSKPMGEFLARYFVKKGFQDGLHGLALSLLQAISFIIVYLKLWELQGLKEQNISLLEVEVETKKNYQELKYWFGQVKLSPNPFKRVIQKVRNKLS